jgi:hypothetical protein
MVGKVETVGWPDEVNQDLDYRDYPVDMRPVEIPPEAYEARGVADRIAGMLLTDLGARGAWVNDACEEWAGPHRNEFDTTWTQLLGELEDVKDDLRRLADDLDDLEGDVWAENLARADLRADFDAENAGDDE